MKFARLLSLRQSLCLCICLALLSASFAVPAPTATSDTNQLSSFLKDIQSMQAKFTQSVYNEKGKQIQKSSGDMYLKKPNQFRWETKKPEQQNIIGDGEKVWVYDFDLKQVTVNLQKQAMDETPAALLSGNIETLQKRFSVKLLQDDPNEKIFQLTAKDSDAEFPTISIEFKQNQIVRMEMNDRLGQRTKVLFDKVSLNQSIDNKLFSFTPPKGIDILDNTKKTATEPD